MANQKISARTLADSIEGSEKIPIGVAGNKAITPDMLKGFVLAALFNFDGDGEEIINLFNLGGFNLSVNAGPSITATSADLNLKSEGSSGGTANISAGVGINKATIAVAENDIQVTGHLHFNPINGKAGFNWGSVDDDPVSLSDGDAWYRTDIDQYRGRRNGVPFSFNVWGYIDGDLSDQVDLQDALNLKEDKSSSVTALTNAATIDIASPVNTLSSSSAARTFTISYTGDVTETEVTLANTAATYTFPATALCLNSDGTASGNNTATLAGVSGDKYLIMTSKIGSAYYVVIKNFGQ